MSQQGQLSHHTDFWYFSDSHRVLFNHSDGFIRKFRTDLPQHSRLINRQRVCSIWIMRGWFGEERGLKFLNPTWFLRLSEVLRWIRQWAITCDQALFLLAALMPPELWNCAPQRAAAPVCTLPGSLSTNGFSCSARLRALKTDRALLES